MNTLIQLIITAVAATSAMTLFSYIVSASLSELYKEPLLLKYLIRRLKSDITDKTMNVLAWLLHYMIGFGFVVCYYFLWLNDIIPLTAVTGLYLGAISGLIGIAGWVIMFKFLNFDKKAADIGYYIQLFIAHVIFGITAIISFMALRNEW